MVSKWLFWCVEQIDKVMLMQVMIIQKNNPEKPIVPTFLIHHFYSLWLGKEKNSNHSQR